MGNIISDIAIENQIKSNIRNIQRKYELRGFIEIYFTSIIKSNNWDKFIIKCCKQINPLWTLCDKYAPIGTFKRMCEIAAKKNNIILSSIIDDFTKFMNDIKPINRPYTLEYCDIIIDFPNGFDTGAVICELPINKLIAIREIYTENINKLRVDQFKYNSSDSDRDILQNLLLFDILSPSNNINTHVLYVSDALQLVNNIPIYCIYRRLV